jgi:tetratricopeptide (TPR) repeat protein
MPKAKTALSIAALLFLLAVAQYGYTFGNPLIWDSREVVLKDPTIRSLGQLRQYFMEGSLPVAAKSPLQYYRPAVKAVYAFEYAAFGTDPRGYHALNVLLNALVVVAFFFAVQNIAGDTRLALCSAALYAVNPARVEAVSWVYGISNVMMGLFILLAFIAYHRRRHGFALPAFALALLSRETSLLFPVVLLAYEFLIRSGEPGRRYVHVVPYAGLGALYLAVRASALGAAPPLTELPALALGNSIAVIVQRMLRIAVVPDAPVAMYPRESFESWSGEVAVSYAVVAVCLAVVAFSWRRDRRLCFGFVWFFVWISIWFNVGRFGDYLMAEKALYLASGGLAVVAASGLLCLRFGPILVGLAVAAHFATTFYRTTYWRDPVVFFEHVVAFAPDLAPARFSLGMKYADRKDYFRAAVQLEQAVRLVPGKSEALNNLGNCYFALGKTGAAKASWERSLAADPGNAETSYNLGMLAERAGDASLALDYYRRYLAREPQPPPAVAARIRQLETSAAAGERP